MMNKNYYPNIHIISTKVLRVINILKYLSCFDRVHFFVLGKGSVLKIGGKFNYFLCFADSFLQGAHALTILFILVLKVLLFLFFIHEEIFR
jgi:hypothetical protein